MKQGCNLSSTLFNIFINDVPNLFDDSCDPVRLGNTNLNCLLYADDLVLLSESQKGLQYFLTKLERYTNRWKLNINKKKSKILLIGTPAQRRTYVTTNRVFDSNILEQVNEYCYLGIIINPSGTFKKALKALHNKALRAYHCLFKKFSNFDNVPISLLLKLFSSIVIPILLYCSEIWGLYILGKITTFEMFKNKMFKLINELLKFCKRILGVH